MTARVTGGPEVTAAAPPGAGPTDDPTDRTVARRTVPIGRLRQLPDWLIAVAVGGLVAAIGVIPQWRGTFFYYVGDQSEQFAPLWHLLGEQLRAGRWPTMDPAGWAGGNYAAEALTGIWNPVSLLDFVLVSHADDLSLAAFAVMVQFLALLAMAVYLLAREYGARRVPAVVVATALPVSGFTLWYEAAGWPAGLMAFTWVAHFWWAAHRHARGRLNPFVPFLFGCLAITTGNPYGVLGLLVVLVAVGVELLLQRQVARLAHLAVMGACVGAVALLVFLPLLGAGPVSDRQQLATVANDAFMVPGLGDLAAGSSPTYLPAIVNWKGAVLEHVPSTYLAWFVLPLLPWLRWDRLRQHRASLAGVFVLGGFYLLAALGPSNLWLFRWPVRVVEYLYLAVAVVFALLLSEGLAVDHGRKRVVASAAVVGLGGYLAWAAQPSGLGGAHVVGVAIVGAATALAVVAHRRWGMPGLGAVVVAGTAAVLVLQTSVLPAGPPTGPVVRPAHEVSAMAAGATEYRGTVLQLAALAGVRTEQVQTGQILFGNLARVVGRETVTAYTGIGFRAFQTELCMDYRGAVCPQAFERLWVPAGRGVAAPLIDVLRVSTLVVQRSLRPDVADLVPPAGWRVAATTPARAVWVRERPWPAEGRVSWTSPGVEVRSDSTTPQREVVRYSARARGSLLFARLAWPGYTATVDGRPADVVDGPAGLLRVEVPAGRHTLAVTYQPPGLRLGLGAVAAAVALSAAQTVAWFWQRRRSRQRAGAGGAVDAAQ
ncbi:MAG: putative integral rane protein [Modestobacter sp.]|jgi:hypothetical protein|nr:putative integral rane protein [Modestobacter sp.]